MRFFLRSCQSAASLKLPISELSQAKEADTSLSPSLESVFLIFVSATIFILIMLQGAGFWLTRPDLVPSRRITKSQFSFHPVAGVPPRHSKV
ncbi:hypothetical protein L6164_037313 [Bauhinia variegata]|uniref:Uncharacterized protein n=1 Tax=Bauhinia variegata TaxID=167791 RepID=A0ACB9KJU0_BAUVA|nr:hypothetical protein L6164_037313 [Bauhinia variegata]